MSEIVKDFIKHPVFSVISQVGKESGIPVYVVGGYVRDCFLGRDSKDIDLVVIGDGISFAQAVARRLGNVKVYFFKNFGTAMFHYDNMEIEFVGARKESYRTDSRKPFVEAGTLEDDQNRRDFTINAMAISLNEKDYGTLIDPFGGMQDLKNKIIRTPLNPDITFNDDPLRMMRATRFASQLLGFALDEHCLQAIQKNKERIKIVSQERITDELNKIMLSEKPSRGFIYLFETGLLKIIFPELHQLHGVEKRENKAHKDNFYHTLEVLDNVAKHSDNLWLRWAALLHDIAKPCTKRFEPGKGWTFHGHEEVGARMIPSIFRRLRLPLDQKMHYVQILVRLHLRPIALVSEEVTDSAVRRLLFEAGDFIEDLMLLCRADITSKNRDKKIRYLRNFEKVMEKMKEVEQKDHIRNFKPPIEGTLIMKIFNIKPSKEIGILKNAIKEAILDGKIANEFDSAYDFLLREASKLNLQPLLSRQEAKKQYEEYLLANSPQKKNV